MYSNLEWKFNHHFALFTSIQAHKTDVRRAMGTNLDCASGAWPITSSAGRCSPVCLQFGEWLACNVLPTR